jgi:hypothetical protein
MKHRLLLASLLSAALCAPALAADPAPAESAAKVEDLAFIAGAWKMAGPPVVEELWTQPAGGTLIGVGRVTGDGQTFFFEYLRIEERPDGIFYVAQPLGGPKVDFKLVKLAAGEAIFENLAHDFPKRIIYRKLENGGLFARTEGDGTEKEKPSEFHYRPADR